MHSPTNFEKRVNSLYSTGLSRETKPIFIKELAHALMEAEKPQDLQPVSWRSSKANVHFQSEFKSLSTKVADGISSSLKAGGLKTQEGPMFQSESDG